jgi:site-specific recombinase XerD
MNQHLLSSLPLERLIDEACNHLKHLDYKPNTINHARRIWQRLMYWAKEHDIKILNPEITEQFLKSIGIPSKELSESLNFYQRRVLLYVRRLEEFSIHGCWRFRCLSESAKASFPPAFEADVKGFLEYCKVQHGNSSNTLREHRHYLLRFTSFLESSGIHSWKDIHDRNLTPFFASQMHLQPRTLSHVVTTLRIFLKYLWLQELHPKDLSPYLPHFRVQRNECIFSIWQQGDVEALLASVDRGSPIGKRDYAILLLVARLGLRAGDIRTIKLDNIHWEKAEIEIVQQKRGNTVLLPLSEEIGQALIDYLRYGRPPVSCREVFVRHCAPFQPFALNDNLYRIIATYRKKAKIKLKYLNHRGLHSLRHTLATRLLEKGTPIETIADILGHVSTETTMSYTKVDIKTLQSAALDPEEIIS